MNCPECFGEVKVYRTVYSEENEVYRCRKCISCGHIFYTMEFEVETNSAFGKEWSRICRNSRPVRPRQNRKVYTLYLRDDGSVVAFGTAEECAKQMNISVQRFRNIFSKTIRGKIKKYEAEIQDHTENLEEE